jgi:hypothetical protein
LPQPGLHASRYPDAPSFQNHLVNSLSDSVALFLREYDAFDLAGRRVQVEGNNVDFRFQSSSPLYD